MSPNERLDTINANYAVPISSAVVLTMHPDQIFNHGKILVDDQGGPGVEAYGAARGALKSLYASAAEIDDAHTKCLIQVPVVGLVKGKASNNSPTEMIVDPKRAPELASSMASRMERTAATTERAINKIDGSIAQLETAITAAVNHPTPDRASVVQVSAEIRQFIKEMNPANRASWIQQQITAGDRDVAHAVCGSSCYTSGISKESHGILKAMARETFAPREDRQLKALLDIRNNKIPAAIASYSTHYHKRLPSTRLNEADAAMAKLRGGV